MPSRIFRDTFLFLKILMATLPSDDLREFKPVKSESKFKSHPFLTFPQAPKKIFFLKVNAQIHNSGHN